MSQSRIYKTYINNDGSYFDMEAMFIPEEDVQKYLNRSLKTCEEVSGTMCKVAYTEEALYYSDLYQENIVYFIANANSISTFTQFKDCIKDFYPEYVGKIKSDIIIKELNNMASSVLDGEYLYPNMKRIIQHKVN